MARVGRPGQPGRLAHGHRQAPRHRPPAPRRERLERKHEELGARARGRAADGRAGPRRRARRPRRRRPAAAVFTACHPVLSTEARVALTLRLLGGLTTEEIARAFLVPEPTVAQRIVRAKRTLAEARVPFEVPRGAELGRAAGSVLEVIYLIFNEGYSATAGDDWMRPGALRGRAAPRPHPGRAGAGRARGARPGRADGDPGLARCGRASARRGEPVLLLDQDRAPLGPAADRPRPAALERAEALGGGLGPYALQAAIAACHARARHARGDRLGRASPRSTTRSPSSRRRRSSSSTAPSRVVDGVRPGGRASSSSTRSPTSRRCARYHLLPSVRGDLLAKLGRARGGPRRVRAGRVADPQRPRARPAPRARRGTRRLGRPAPPGGRGPRPGRAAGARAPVPVDLVGVDLPPAALAAAPAGDRRAAGRVAGQAGGPSGARLASPQCRRPMITGNSSLPRGVSR